MNLASVLLSNRGVNEKIPAQTAYEPIDHVLRGVLAKSVRSAFDWKRAMNQFAILFGERFMLARG